MRGGAVEIMLVIMGGVVSSLTWGSGCWPGLASDGGKASPRGVGQGMVIKRGGTIGVMLQGCTGDGGSLPGFQHAGLASGGRASLTFLTALGPQSYLPSPFITAQ